MSKATIHYHDIGDYLSREAKLAIIKKNHSIANMQWQTLTPNEHGDWLNQRNDAFSTFIPLEPEKKFDAKAKSFFIANSLGTVTARDSWVYNFSTEVLSSNIKKTIEHYNSERELVNAGGQPEVITNSLLGSWSRDWQNNLKKNKAILENPNEYRLTAYRPFVKINSYFDDDLNQERYQLLKVFPTKNHKNLLICVSGVGASKDFSVLITNNIPNYDSIEKSNCFPLYYYEENESRQTTLFDKADEGKYIRRDAVSDFILERAKQQYGKIVTKEDIFYYVYGFLHSPKYREMFASDLKKMLPRLPLVDDVRNFWAFSKVGRALAELHLNYEKAGKCPGVVEYNTLSVSGSLKQANAKEVKYFDYRVEKMRFPKKDQKDTIIYNSQITLKKVPAQAYDYVVNGKSAIEWIMERYQIMTHKESGIVNDPNDWSKETGNPRYILDLLLSVINVSVQTMKIVENLPDVKTEE